MIKRTLYFGNPAYLSLKDEQVVIKIPAIEKRDFDDEVKQKAIRTIPIEDIGVLILDNKQITITQGLLEKLLENNCAVVTCDSTCLPVGLMLPLCGNSIQTERMRDQIEASLPLKKQLWQQTIIAKIENQAHVLREMRNAEIGNMQHWANDVRSGDSENKEARAAAYYWKNAFPTIKDFVRSREGDAPNNLLNYGYAILRAVIARALVSNGLLPTFGIHHKNKYNAYCLADDIMEPYRPYVDRLIMQIFDSQIDCSAITKDIKVKLLEIPVMEVCINNLRRPLMVAASITTSSLQKCFAGESRKILYPSMS